MTDVSLQEQFGHIDIYLFDQLLKERILPGMRIFDAGCGSGRNLAYFIREGYQVAGVDSDPNAIANLQRFGEFRTECIETNTFEDACADVVLSSAVLHFAHDDDQFLAMLRGSWRVLKPGGLFFCRLASTIGMEQHVSRIGGRRFHVPDGSERYLVDEALIMNLTVELGGEMLDPLKTTVVQNQRSMTTWIVRKNPA